MIEIVYSDRDLIVVNKPPGMPVHPGVSVSGETLVGMLLERFPEIRGVGDNFSFRPGIVHRLDKDTSGVMVVARNQYAFDALKQLFKSRQVEKIYRAIVCGRLRENQGIISFPIGRSIKNPLKRAAVQGKSAVRGEREAITEYRLIKEWEGLSLVELCPKTGRTHQLRVHMKAIGHPVACDRVYGGKNVCCPEGADRQMLHAQSISFSFDGGRRFRFEADPPEDFSRAVRVIDSAP